MRGLKIGLHIGADTVPGLLDGIAEAERAGLACAWLTSGGVRPDPFSVLAVAARETPRIELGTSIVPTFPRHPLTMVQGAVVIDDLAPGRLRLGIGPSHQPMIERMYGIPFARAHRHLREYLTILRTILREGRVAFHGDLLHAEAELPHPTQVRVLCSALRANGFRIGGELSEGAISWVCPLPYLRDVALPALHDGARRANRPPPPLIGHVPVVVSTDTAAVRTAARAQLGFYPRVPFYSRMFQDAGFPEAADGLMSDRMVDALVISGDEQTVTNRLRAIPTYGVEELLAMRVTLPEDPDAAGRTLAVLGALAREA